MRSGRDIIWAGEGFRNTADGKIGLVAALDILATYAKRPARRSGSTTDENEERS